MKRIKHNNGFRHKERLGRRPTQREDIPKLLQGAKERQAWHNCRETRDYQGKGVQFDLLGFLKKVVY